MLGLDMLLATVIKALGLNPEEVQKQLSDFITFVRGKINEFDCRLAQMEQQQKEIHAMLLRQQGEPSNSKKEVSALLAKVSVEQSEIKQ